MTWLVAICDKQGWRDFEIQLSPELECEMLKTQARVAFLRERLNDSRFSGHAMIMEPTKIVRDKL